MHLAQSHCLSTAVTISLNDVALLQECYTLTTVYTRI